MNQEDRKIKPVSESKSEMSILMMPEHSNLFGKVHGGVILKYMDQLGYICAAKHAERPCITASMDRVDFHAPVEVGDVVTMYASANYTGKTSIEVGIKVMSESPVEGEGRHTNSSYATLVALSDDGKPVTVPKVKPETDEEKRRYKEAKERYKMRKNSG